MTIFFERVMHDEAQPNRVDACIEIVLNPNDYRHMGFRTKERVAGTEDEGWATRNGPRRVFIVQERPNVPEP